MPLESGFYDLFTGACEHAVNTKRPSLPFLTCSKADTQRYLVSWISELIQDKTVLEKKTRLAFEPHQLPDPAYSKAVGGPLPAQRQSSSAPFHNTSLEKLSQVRPNTVVTRRLAFFSSFLHLPLLHVNKPQMLRGIPQAHTPQSLLRNQPASNPSKHPHPSYKQQLPADPF